MTGSTAIRLLGVLTSGGGEAIDVKAVERHIATICAVEDIYSHWLRRKGEASFSSVPGIVRSLSIDLAGPWGTTNVRSTGGGFTERYVHVRID